MSVRSVLAGVVVVVVGVGVWAYWDQWRWERRTDRLVREAERVTRDAAGRAGL